MPALNRENEIIERVWAFCGGWNPAVLPIALAYYDVVDPLFVVEQLLAMRDCIHDYEAARDSLQNR